MSSDARRTPAGTGMTALERLEDVLRRQVAGHGRLLATIEAKHRAIRRADFDAITALCGDEQRIARELTELDGERRQAVHAAATTLGRPADPVTVAELADAAPAPRRARLLDVAGELRALVRRVRRASTVARAAAEALNGHMIGVMQVAHSALSRAGVYGAQGRISPGRQLPCRVDVRS
ncbi:MAG: flagellar protein FlgN [Planctomycetota bacterium]|jgi:hypothetical protein